MDGGGPETYENKLENLKKLILVIRECGVLILISNRFQVNILTVSYISKPLILWPDARESIREKYNESYVIIFWW